MGLYNLISKSFLAGFLIGIGVIVNLKVGGYLGPGLFSIGLLLICYNQLPLYTGKLGLCENYKDLIYLPIILLFNLIGISVLALLARYSYPELIDKANIIVTNRIESSTLTAIVSSFLCGLLMYFACHTFKTYKSSLLVVLCVSVFILSGYWHCIADTGYYVIADVNTIQIIVPLLITIFFNFVGGCFSNLILNKSIYYK